MTTLLLTGYNDQFAPLGDLTAPRMLAYAGKHGYDFKCFRHPGSGIASSWHKVQATLDGLLHYERVLWVDADMLITNDEITHDYDWGFHASMDWGKDATHPQHFSTGAYVICGEAANIFEDVVALKDELLEQGIWEQQPIRDTFHWASSGMKIHDRREFNAVHPAIHPDIVDPWQPGDWACHFTMVPLEVRVRLCKEMLP